MRRPRPAVVVLALSIALIVVTALSMLVLQRQAVESVQVESVGSRDLASLAPVTPSPSGSLPAPSTSPTPQATPTGTPVPVRVRIPDIDVAAKVLPVGLDKAGAVAIPEDIMKVGWYELGVAPGADQGSAVLVAHRDGVVQGHGVFYDLGTLSVGDKVFVIDSSGTRQKYRVVARESISKKRLPLEELFAIDGPPRLTLISCGGYYDKDNGGYQDNVVVTAVRVGDTVGEPGEAQA